MRWFSTEVVKALRARGRMPKLYISGVWNDDIKASVTSAYPEAVFTGFVDDLSAFLNGKISIVPIRIGSGMRMKIIDSISASSPLVTTSKGCEGLPCSDNDNCLIADTADTFADAIIRMSDDEKLQEQCARKAISTLRTTLDAEKLLRLRMEFYKNVENGLKK
jgi:glycosyltransferase involved in cell wall biosynthesis